MNPRPPRTDRSQILDAALALLDEEGTDALTMRALGARLGVDPMTIYRYVPSQAALHDGIVERIWTQADAERGAPGSTAAWRDVVAQLALALRAAMLAHPGAAVMVATRPGVTGEQLQLLESVLEDLGRCGVPADEGMRVLDRAVALVVGCVLGELRIPQGGVDTAVEDVAAEIRPERFPRLASAFAGGYGWDPGAGFERALAALLAGWEVSSPQA